MEKFLYEINWNRFGTALTKYGNLRVLKAENEKDLRPLEEGCECSVKVFSIQQN